jgi:hypothetical protein
VLGKGKAPFMYHRQAAGDAGRQGTQAIENFQSPEIASGVGRRLLHGHLPDIAQCIASDQLPCSSSALTSRVVRFDRLPRCPSPIALCQLPIILPLRRLGPALAKASERRDKDIRHLPAHSLVRLLSYLDLHRLPADAGLLVPGNPEQVGEVLPHYLLRRRHCQSLLLPRTRVLWI